MKTTTKFVIGGLAATVAAGGFAWWNRYVVITATYDATGITATRTFALTEAGARTAAAAASKAAKPGQTVYITHKKKVVAAYNVGTDMDSGANSEALTALYTMGKFPLSGVGTPYGRSYMN